MPKGIMRKIQWLVPIRKFGQHLKPATFKFDPDFLAALDQYAKDQGIAKASVLLTYALKNPTLRELYRQQDEHYPEKYKPRD